MIISSEYKYDVSIIIVNYRTQCMIVDCLETIRDHVKDMAYEVIVVDNASGEDYKSYIESRVPGMCSYVDLKENIGFGRGNNAGVEISSGRNIFFLNPDTLLLNNAVKILSDYLDCNERVGAVGGNLYDENMKAALSYRRIMPGIWWEFNEILGFLPEKIIYGKNRRFNYGRQPLKVGYITGADLMVPRKVFDEVKGFCPDFFMYYEETDLCLRISELGYLVVNNPGAKIQHLEGKSFTNELNKARLERIERGRATYLRRNCKGLSGKVCDILHHLLLKSRVLIKNSESCRCRLEFIEKNSN